MIIESCTVCPRACGARRDEQNGAGFCKMGSMPVIARAAAHYWEEPCISGTNGSGAVFFSGCTLKCVYCQNFEISAQNTGKAVTPAELADIYKSLFESGVHNINLVSASHFIDSVIESLDIYKPPIPVVYNCSGYESIQSIKRLDGYADIFLPDFKYADDKLAMRYSSAPDYTQTAISAISQMIKQTGEPQFSEEGLLQKGTIIRHLVLPMNTKNSIAVLKLIKQHFDKAAMVSLMAQYVPCGRASEFAELNRRITKREYQKVADVLFDLELDGFLQELSSADKSFIPDFDLTGVKEILKEPLNKLR